MECAAEVERRRCGFSLCFARKATAAPSYITPLQDQNEPKRCPHFVLPTHATDASHPRSQLFVLHLPIAG